MSSDGEISISYGPARQGIDDMMNANNEITAQMEDLETQVKNILPNWTGTTADTYRQCAQKISQALTHSTMVLANTAGATGQGVEDLQNRDKKLSNLFAG
ncbi:WXG100 family type VII secretion target [Amycolatopsis samaneae]|uniref:WXG100 family type VII secretion target n=1 Tax=Amycolatopsis samaneae TaxID=664691 RepID=A0ABW5GRJ5_9PSEU